MITKRELLDAITECENSSASYQTCEKLAVFYSLYDRLFAEKQEAEPKIFNAPLRSDSEFLRAVAEKDFTSALAVLDELMDSLKILQPRLYDAVMRKLRE